MKKLSILILILLIISIISPVFADNPAEYNSSDYFNYVSEEHSTWNVNEQIPNGTLSNYWSALNVTSSYTNWCVSNKSTQLENWYGNQTLLFNNSVAGEDFSALFCNYTKANRTQSLIVTYVNSSHANKNYVFSGVIYAFYNATNFSMILFGDNELFLFDYKWESGKGDIYNTINGTKVTTYSTADNYWNSSWISINPSVDKVGIKTLYNTYCGKLWSKNFNVTTNLMNETTGWLIENLTIENATTNDSTCFGICFWNPSDKLATFDVHYDYIEMFRENYTTNSSVNYMTYPRPHMDFPVLNMSSIGDDFADLILPAFIGGLEVNISNEKYTRIMKNMTMNFTENSRMNSEHGNYDYLQDDFIYYYSSVLTNFTSWAEGALPDWISSQFYSNNYLCLFIQNPKQERDGFGDLGYDYLTVFINPDGDKTLHHNSSKFYFLDSWDERLSFTYNSTAGAFTSDIEIEWAEDMVWLNTSKMFGYIFTTEESDIKNIHRYGTHTNALVLIPIYDLIKSDGNYLTNDDIFDLGINWYCDEDSSICTWQDWDERNCSVHHTENAEESSIIFTNESYDFIETIFFKQNIDLWDCLMLCLDYADLYYSDNYTEWMDYMSNCWEMCIREYTMLHYDNDQIELTGEGEIATNPPINSTQGHYDLELDVSTNVSYFDETQSTGNQTVNITWNVCNPGDMNLTNLTINVTWLNCSCSDWKFWFIDSNISNDNITFYNDSCYVILNISNLTYNNCDYYWLTFNISECTDIVGRIIITTNVSTPDGFGTYDEDVIWIEWGLGVDNIRITGKEDVVDSFDIASTVLMFTGICILIAAILAIISVVKGGDIF